jgi:hypothetical protein
MGRALLYGIFLPWVLVCAGISLVQSMDGFPARQGVEVLETGLKEHDLILTDGRVGAMIYWEWSRRMGRSEKIHVVKAASQTWFLPDLHPINIENLNFKGIDRVWFFFSPEGKLKDSLTKHLSELGFKPLKDLSKSVPFLLVFSRQQA